MVSSPWTDRAIAQAASHTQCARAGPVVGFKRTERGVITRTQRAIAQAASHTQCARAGPVVDSMRTACRACRACRAFKRTAFKRTERHHHGLIVR